LNKLHTHTHTHTHTCACAVVNSSFADCMANSPSEGKPGTGAALVALDGPAVLLSVTSVAENYQTEHSRNTFFTFFYIYIHAFELFIRCLSNNLKSGPSVAFC